MLSPAVLVLERTLMNEPAFDHEKLDVYRLSPCLTGVVGWFICPLIGAAIGLTFGYVRESNQPIFGLAYSLESICMTTLLGAILGHIVCRRILTVPASRKMR